MITGDAVFHEIAKSAVDGTLVISHQPVSDRMDDWARLIAKRPFELLDQVVAPASWAEKQMFFIYGLGTLLV